MKKKNCIGAKRWAGDQGKCNGERLFSWKYNGRKEYCLECYKYKNEQYKEQIRGIRFAI
jgi:hypothetical protein